MTQAQAPSSALYETTRRQPEILRATLADAAGPAARAAEALAAARRVWLVGTGTSSHAAIVGEHLLRLAGVDAYGGNASDFVLYPRPLAQDDALIVVSHRGTKRFGTQAIARGLEAGLPVIGLTGQGSPMEGPRVVIQTAPPERSSAHSASYTANLAALALVAVAVGERRGADVAPLRAALEAMPETVAALLAREADLRPVAEALAARGRLVLAGAGPNAVTAREGALKVKETSYLVAEGFELETLLHGPLQAVEAGDVAVVIAADGPAVERTGEALRALGMVGARPLVVADERAAPRLPAVDGATTITFAAVPEALSPLPATVPLQLLAALAATLRGTDADGFRADDPIYKAANATYNL
jgi:glucosamine--fructose-6-phosphate aminotransferase (isomerizing)